jgi:uncharacterized protein (TIGR02444 family)
VAIWEWVLAVYDRPGVPDATLALQDNHGQNTSFLLWAVYARATDRGLLDKAAATARAWDQTALIPLRQARRALKTPLLPIDDGAREAFRQDVKALELAAERLLMEALAGLADQGYGVGALEALSAAAEAWGEAPPAPALADLARVLG